AQLAASTGDPLRDLRAGGPLQTVGSYEVWAAPDAQHVLALISAVRGTNPVLAHEGRRQAHHRRATPAGRHVVFGACAGRVPMSPFPAVATNARLAPLDPLDAATSAFSVAVVDTGIVPGHPWFEDRVRALDDCDLRTVEDPLPEEGGLLATTVGHGTLVAGIVLGEAPAARLVAVRGLVDGAAADADLAGSILELKDRDDVRLVNLSFGGREDDLGAPAVLEEAIGELDPDVVVVAAAGNSGRAQDVWPGTFDRVIAVGAVEQGSQPRPAPFSNRGPSVDVYASGVSLVAPFCTFAESGGSAACRPAQRFTGWARVSGTSFAAAVVTGRIARLAVAEGIPPREAADRLLAT
ncbi:MAG: S8 family peptidase, partial [Actinomycetes bacterium]